MRREVGRLLGELGDLGVALGLRLGESLAKVREHAVLLLDHEGLVRALHMLAQEALVHLKDALVLLHELLRGLDVDLRRLDAEAEARLLELERRRALGRRGRGRLVADALGARGRARGGGRGRARGGARGRARGARRRGARREQLGQARIAELVKLVDRLLREDDARADAHDELRALLDLHLRHRELVGDLDGAVRKHEVRLVDEDALADAALDLRGRLDALHLLVDAPVEAAREVVRVRGGLDDNREDRRGLGHRDGRGERRAEGRTRDVERLAMDAVRNDLAVQLEDDRRRVHLEKVRDERLDLLGRGSDVLLPLDVDRAGGVAVVDRDRELDEAIGHAGRRDRDGACEWSRGVGISMV